MVQTITDFNHEYIDGDEYFNSHLEHFGWILLWRPAPYHWVAMNIEQKGIFNYCEGDLTEYQYDTEKEFMEALQETKDWWVKHEGKDADPVLAGCAEPYGFLTGGVITLTPPRCDKCRRKMYPTHDTNQYSCLRCD